MSISRNMKVGILHNPNFKASVLSYTYIRRVLEEFKINVVDLTLDQLIAGEYNCDVVFNIYYGDIGDGSVIPSLLLKQKMPYVGNNVYSNTLMLNKVISKRIFLESGFHTPKFWYEQNLSVSTNELMDIITEDVMYPILAKPVNGASAGGISLIHSENELGLFLEYNKNLVSAGYYFFEEYIDGIELTAGHVNFIGSQLPVMELELFENAKKEGKFSSNHKEKIIPARVPDEIYSSAQRSARQLHERFECSAFSRTDFLFEPISKKIYVLEINTNPAFLERSIFMTLLKEAGVSESQFFGSALEHALKV